jgi:Flp pilus assembly protein TadG
MTKSRGGERGNVMIEFALSAMLLFVILGGVFSFGYTEYVYDALGNAVTGGASYASRVTYDANNLNTVRTQVKNVVVYGSPAGGGLALAPGLTTANVDVSWTLDGAGVPRAVTVKIINYPVNAIFRNFTLTDKPSYTLKFAGNFVT